MVAVFVARAKNVDFAFVGRADCKFKTINSDQSAIIAILIFGLLFDRYAFWGFLFHLYAFRCNTPTIRTYKRLSIGFPNFLEGIFRLLFPKPRDLILPDRGRPFFMANLFPFARRCVL